jgi:hypothetical protein
MLRCPPPRTPGRWPLLPPFHAPPGTLWVLPALPPLRAAVPQGTSSGSSDSGLRCCGLRLRFAGRPEVCATLHPTLHPPHSPCVPSRSNLLSAPWICPTGPLKPCAWPCCGLWGLVPLCPPPGAACAASVGLLLSRWPTVPAAGPWPPCSSWPPPSLSARGNPAAAPPPSWLQRPWPCCCCMAGPACIGPAIASAASGRGWWRGWCGSGPDRDGGGSGWPLLLIAGTVPAT